MARIEVCVEVVEGKRAFASALDWPGWSRSGRTEEAAVRTLLDYAPRYAGIARRAGLRLATEGHEVEVVDRAPGDASTVFGAPSTVAAVEEGPVPAAGRRRLAALLEACWAELDAVASGAPASLRKGPRGGGRDRDAVVEHVVSAEVSYARKLGVRFRQPAAADREAVRAYRGEILAAVIAGSGPEPPAGRTWPVRYLVRRTAWHAIDHAWEIEDRSRPAPD